MQLLKRISSAKSKVPLASPWVGAVLLLQACSGGSSDEPVDLSEITLLEDDGSVLAMPFDPLSARAGYRVTVRNFWNAQEYPEGFPVDAHFSLFGGAVHDGTYSMWEFGEQPSVGIEDMAETGRIDILLFDEVAPFVEFGSVDSLVEVRVFTGPAVADEPGELEFEITVTQDYPLLSLVSMLGPSPDWFVGVDGQSLQVGDDVVEWAESMVVPLPLYDGGSKSDVIPVMGGPDIIPPDPIGLVAYDQATGTYQPSAEEQIVGELVFTRIE